MRATRPIRAFLTFAGSLAIVGAATAANKPTAPTDAVSRGEYLSKVAHCAACHTADPAKPFAGNVPLASPFGTMYASNITPDPVDGIGRWTEHDFEGALRRGVGKGGAYLYPSMPYGDFTKISDADVHALWLYFRSVKPIASAVSKNTMTFPFNVRTGIGAWQTVYFHPGRYADDPSQSAEWNRGAYLVQGLGHCGACHTPTNVAMAPVKGKALQGNVIDHWFAPDISGGRFSNINKWNEDELVNYFRNGHNDKNLAAVGPMQQTIDLGLSQLSDQDLHAIAVYLKHQVAGTESAPSAGRAVTAQERTSGEAIYAANCVTCHAASGQGVAGVAPSLVGAGSTNGAKSDTAVRAILQGFAPSGPWGVMPAFAQVLTAQQVSDVANYVRTAWGNKGSGEVTVSSVTHLAMYSDLGGTDVESALVCPSATAAEVDAATLAQIKALADAPQPQQATAKLVADYRTRHPKVDRTNLVTTISGAYCRDVMAANKGTLAERQVRYVNFMGGVAQAAASR
jgi:mono/diheme cytochrome c family protein